MQKTDMNREQENDLTATTQATGRASSTSPGTMADYTAGSRVLHTAWPVAWLRGDSGILVRAFRGVREAGDVLRDAPAGG